MSAHPRIVVYTCITGGKDNLKDDQVTGDLPFHAFLDRPVNSDVWRVHSAIGHFKDPRRNSRTHKILAHQFFPGADITVWIDGTISIKKNIMPLVDDLMSKYDIATFRHPERDCLYEEAAICKKYKLDNTALIDRQIIAYRNKEVPENLGLYECNVLIRKNNERVRYFNLLWWAEFSIHSRRDQLSMPFAAKEAGVAIGVIPGNAQNIPHMSSKRTGNDYFSWQNHLHNN